MIKYSWHIISGKNHDFKSSIGAHSINLSLGLTKANEDVHIWQSSKIRNSSIPNASHLKIERHQLSSKWNKAAFNDLSNAIDAIPGNKIIFIQFSPQNFGSLWSTSLPNWMAERKKKGDKIWTMVHASCYYPKKYTRNPSKWWLQKMQTLMLEKSLKCSERVFVSTEYLIPQVKDLLANRAIEISALPIPSNINIVKNKQSTANLRLAFAAHANFILGTFGSYFDSALTHNLSWLIPKLLKNNAERIWLCLGRGSHNFAKKLRSEHPEIALQIETAGELDTAAISAHIQACDLMIQPYPNGVNTAHSSVMAGLSHAKPIVTTLGIHTEKIWQESLCVSLNPSDNLEFFRQSVEELMTLSSFRQSLAEKAQQTYANYFSLEQSIKKLLK